MNDLMQPLIHKAAVQDIAINITKARLSIGDAATLHLMPDGRVGVFVRLLRRFLGLIPRQVTVLVGTLGPQASAIVAPAVERHEFLRVRIVGLTPEHLATEAAGPEIHISVWGDPRHLPTPTFKGPAHAPGLETGANRT